MLICTYDTVKKKFCFILNECLKLMSILFVSLKQKAERQQSRARVQAARQQAIGRRNPPPKPAKK